MVRVCRLACSLVLLAGVGCSATPTGGGPSTTVPTNPLADARPILDEVQQISASANHVCVVVSRGGVKCWGLDTSGELGDGRAPSSGSTSLEAVDVIGLSGPALAVAAGDGHSCAVLVGGSVECWGSNGVGQLGDGTTSQSSTAVRVKGVDDAVSVAAGSGNSCAVIESGGVKCWGNNYFDQLGSASVSATHALHSAVPVTVEGLAGPATKVDLGVQTPHICALLQAGEVQCWGHNEVGEIGTGQPIGSFSHSPIPRLVPGVAGPASDISAGTYDTCITLRLSGVQCWGNNYLGQLGNGQTSASATPVDVVVPDQPLAISAGASKTCTLLTGGRVWCWGQVQAAVDPMYNVRDGTLLPSEIPGLFEPAFEIATGNSFACAIVSLGRVQCFGDSYGALGVPPSSPTMLSPVLIRTMPSATPTDRLTTLRVGTWNVASHYRERDLCLGGSRWDEDDGPSFSDTIADRAAEENLDVLMMQEVYDQTGCTDDFTAISDSMNEGGYTCHWGQRDGGLVDFLGEGLEICVKSNLQFKSITPDDGGIFRVPLPYSSSDEFAQRAEVTKDGVIFQLLNVHTLGGDEGMAQRMALDETFRPVLKGRSNNYIIGGDFNFRAPNKSNNGLTPEYQGLTDPSVVTGQRYPNGSTLPDGLYDTFARAHPSALAFDVCPRFVQNRALDHPECGYSGLGDDGLRTMWPDNRLDFLFASQTLQTVESHVSVDAPPRRAQSDHAMTVTEVAAHAASVTNNIDPPTLRFDIGPDALATGGQGHTTSARVTIDGIETGYECTSSPEQGNDGQREWTDCSVLLPDRSLRHTIAIEYAGGVDPLHLRRVRVDGYGQLYFGESANAVLSANGGDGTSGRFAYHPFAVMSGSDEIAEQGSDRTTTQLNPDPTSGGTTRFVGAPTWQFP